MFATHTNDTFVEQHFSVRLSPPVNHTFGKFTFILSFVSCTKYFRLTAAATTTEKRNAKMSVSFAQTPKRMVNFYSFVCAQNENIKRFQMKCRKQSWKMCPLLLSLIINDKTHSSARFNVNQTDGRLNILHLFRFEAISGLSTHRLPLGMFVIVKLRWCCWEWQWQCLQQPVTSIPFKISEFNSKRINIYWQFDDSLNAIYCFIAIQCVSTVNCFQSNRMAIWMVRLVSTTIILAFESIDTHTPVEQLQIEHEILTFFVNLSFNKSIWKITIDLAEERNWK